jgi:hypothetical protein
MINFLLKIIVWIFFIKIETGTGRLGCFKLYRFFSIYFISFYNGKLYYNQIGNYHYQNPVKTKINKLTKNLKDIESIKIKYIEEELNFKKKLGE